MTDSAPRFDAKGFSKVLLCKTFLLHPPARPDKPWFHAREGYSLYQEFHRHTPYPLALDGYTMYPSRMKLAEWINSHPKEQRLDARKRLAKRLGVSEVYVRSMANGNKPIPVMLALEIQHYTRGKVPVSDSCPKFAAKLSRSMEATP